MQLPMMARVDVFSRRRQRAACADDEDRLSDLPDDLLLHILRRVNTRTALGAAGVSRHWASLTRELPALDLKVTDILTPRYYRLRLLRYDAREWKIRSTLADRRRLDCITGRYERRAMVRSVKRLLASRARARRRVERLSLEVFAYDASSCINRLVVDAVDSWGVRDPEVVATPTGPLAYPDHPPPYSFPRGLISRNPRESRLRSLKLAHCLC
uniref:Uncharacterized protein n=1 Tax=Avena sativa TaxID=4498 RepID=A0ACD5T7Y3_AVESA